MGRRISHQTKSIMSDFTIIQLDSDFEFHPLKPRKQLSIFEPEPEPIKSSARCIVLDVDGTLVDNVPLPYPDRLVRLPTPVARPGLKEFLEFVFAEFECVIIWTAAKRVWYDKVYNEVLHPNLPPGKDFNFVKTRDASKPYVPLKPLSEIYEQFPQYNATNTVVVDDNPATFKANVENAVHVPEFFQDLLSKEPEERERLAALDRGLYDAVAEIRRRLFEMNT